MNYIIAIKIIFSTKNNERDGTKYENSCKGPICLFASLYRESIYGVFGCFCYALTKTCFENIYLLIYLHFCSLEYVKNNLIDQMIKDFFFL